MEKDDKNLLDEFEFDAPNLGDFFGVPGTAVEKIEDSDDDKKKSKEKEDDDIDLDDEDFDFEGSKSKEELEDKSKKKEPKKNDDASTDETNEVFSNLSKDLVDLGVFTNVEFGEDEEINSDVFFEKFEEELNVRVENSIKALVDDLDDDAAAFLQFKAKGGNTADFFKLYGQTASLPVSSVDSEEDQKAFLEYYFKAEDELDDDDIEDRIQSLEESGKLERYAKRYFNKIQDKQKEEKEALIERQEEAKRESAEQQKKFQTSLKSIINNKKEISDLPIDSKKDAFLVDFIMKPVYSKEDKTNATGFQRKLAEIFRDEEKLILLAKLVHSDFDFTSIKKKNESDINKKNLKTIKSNRTITSRNSERKSITDYF